MPAIMMSGRDVKRVPLDFDWPIDKVWSGYQVGPELRFPQCQQCDGDGYSLEARAISQTFYPHMLQATWDPAQRELSEALAWHDKIGQAEVDNLVAEGRLRELQSREPTEDNPRDWEWVSVPRTAAEVNAANRNVGLGSHDGINRCILVRFRCERLGIVVECPTCAGHGDIATDEQREAADKWERTEPPTGDGYQLWETVSEGSPITPVFASADELANWCASNLHKPATRERMSAVEWGRLIGGETHGLNINTGEMV